MGERGLRVIVCGGRDFCKTDVESAFLYLTLDLIHAKTPIGHVWHGNARGVDSCSGIWAWRRKVQCTPVPARWKDEGKSAGPKRNQRMLGQSIDLVIAFPGGRGTDDMIRRAEKAGVTVKRIAYPANPTPTP